MAKKSLWSITEDPVTKLSNEKLRQMRITFDTQMKTAPTCNDKMIVNNNDLLFLRIMNDCTDITACILND